MKKCEHKVEVISQGILFLPQFNIGLTPEEQAKKLNEAGQEGWKLIHVKPRRLFLIFTQIVAYYVREQQ